MTISQRRTRRDPYDDDGNGAPMGTGKRFEFSVGKVRAQEGGFPAINAKLRSEICQVLEQMAPQSKLQRVCTLRFNVS